MKGNVEEKGLIPLVIQEMFRKAEERREDYNTVCKISYLEIYNETIIDLLGDD